MTDLLDLPTGPVIKIVAGGFVTAALTAGNDVYIWGAKAGHNSILDDVSGRPNPLDIMGLDLIDISIGDRHIIVLTADKRLLVIGDSSSGQLGLGKLAGGSSIISQWMELRLDLSPGKKIINVIAKGKNSFLLVKTGSSLKDPLNREEEKVVET